MQSHPLCHRRMQVHHICQETPDVWTIALINHDYYRWHAGQYALVQIAGSDLLRPYTLSSTPGQSKFITLTVRYIAGGKGSGWLTQQLKIGDYIWLSDALGDFSCERHPANSYLMLAAGCGITPIISMCRWLHANRPDCRVTLCYSVHSAEDIIFADELSAMRPWLNLTIITRGAPTADMPTGRITQAKLQSLVPDIAGRTVMICGPSAYMQQVEAFVRELGAAEICLEHFTPTKVEQIPPGGPRFTLRSSDKTETGAFSPGTTLLDAMEHNHFAVNTACRVGVCGCCKTRILTGNYSSDSTQTLNAEDIAAGYVLACSCKPTSDIILA